MSAPLSLISKVLDIYEQYNPALLFASLKVDPPVTPYLHQVEFLLRTILRRPVRVFLADEIGLGKTITTLVTLKRLERLGLLKRVLIAVPRILIPQWLSELDRVGLSLKVRRIERNTFDQLLAEGLPEGYYLASMDLIKRGRYFDELQKVPWDAVVVDEAHRIGKRPGSETERFKKIGEGLVASFAHRDVIFLSATPHRGDPEDYIERLRVLDPYLDAGKHLDNVSFYALTHNVLMFRRSKLDVNEIYEARKIFTDCKLEAIVIPATAEEVDFHRRLIAFLRTKIIEFHERMKTESKALGLLMATIFKRASSSPYAAIKTMERIIEKRSKQLALRELAPLVDDLEEEAPSVADSIFGLGYDDYSDLEEYEESVEPDDVLNEFASKCSSFIDEEDLEELKALVGLAKTISQKDSRMTAVKELVKLYVHEGRKVIVFSEYRDTAKYIFDVLQDALGKGAVVLLTSEEARDWRELVRIRKRFEKDPSCSVMVATDVASEGLNLQVASVLLNYEPPWSPVKLEQRMGRVWRLGQKQDVVVHTLFLAVDSDKDVLDVLYRKLIALGRAISPKKPLIGEEALVIDMSGESAPLQIKDIVKDKRKYKVTEYALREEYIKGGRDALNELVDLMVVAIEKLKEDLRRLNVLPKINKLTLLNLMKDCAAFSNMDEVFDSVKRLLRSALNFAKRQGLGFNFVEDQGVLKVIPIGGAPVVISDSNIALQLIKVLLSQQATFKGVPYIVAAGDRDEEVRVYELVIERTGSGEPPPLYKEPVGVTVLNEVRVLRGKELLDVISSALDNIVFTADEQLLDLPDGKQMVVSSSVKQVGRRIIDLLSRDFIKYREHLARRGWRRPNDNWCPNGADCLVKIGRLLGVIRFTSPGSITLEREIDPITKRRIEFKAMEFAMNYEKAQGREPMDVSSVEHFDILSRDPGTGSIRYIEVKGHAGTSLIAELSEEEYEIARSKGENYWLYIVHGIGLGKPQLVAITNPIKNMKIKVEESKRYILHP